MAYALQNCSYDGEDNEFSENENIIEKIDTVSAIYHTTHGFLTCDFYYMVTSKYMKTKKYWAKTPNKNVYWDLMSKQAEVLSLIEISARDRSCDNFTFFKDTMLECYFVAQDNVTLLPDFSRSFKISDVAYNEIYCLPSP